MKLLNVDANVKTVKNRKVGYLTGVLYLAPADLSGHEVCPMRTAGCTAACLNTAGRGAMKMVQDARIRKTKQFFDDRKAFLNQLYGDIAKVAGRAARQGLKPAIRLNGTSDIPWENIKLDGKNMMEHFPNVQFYDYTKVPKRFLSTRLPDNYHLTFSLAENNEKAAKRVLAAGGNVAVVFKGKLPREYLDHKVIDGDAHDARFLPQGLASSKHKGVVVGLLAKGKAKHDTTGFVKDGSIIAASKKYSTVLKRLANR